MAPVICSRVGSDEGLFARHIVTFELNTFFMLRIVF